MNLVKKLWIKVNNNETLQLVLNSFLTEYVEKGLIESFGVFDADSFDYENEDDKNLNFLDTDSFFITFDEKFDYMELCKTISLIFNTELDCYLTGNFFSLDLQQNLFIGKKQLNNQKIIQNDEVEDIFIDFLQEEEDELFMDADLIQDNEEKLEVDLQETHEEQEVVENPMINKIDLTGKSNQTEEELIDLKIIDDLTSNTEVFNDESTAFEEIIEAIENEPVDKTDFSNIDLDHYEEPVELKTIQEILNELEDGIDINQLNELHEQQTEEPFDVNELNTLEDNLDKEDEILAMFDELLGSDNGEIKDFEELVEIADDHIEDIANENEINEIKDDLSIEKVEFSSQEQNTEYEPNELKELPVKDISNVEPIIIEKEVIKEVPIEIIKEVEVPKEIIVEKEVIKEVPIEIIKEVEVPKEIIVEKEVIKEVEVPKEIIVEKEVIKEVPIEIIKEVEVIKEIIKEVPIKEETKIEEENMCIEKVDLTTKQEEKTEQSVELKEIEDLEFVFEESPTIEENKEKEECNEEVVCNECEAIAQQPEVELELTNDEENVVIDIDAIEEVLENFEHDKNNEDICCECNKEKQEDEIIKNGDVIEEVKSEQDVPITLKTIEVDETVFEEEKEEVIEDELKNEEVPIVLKTSDEIPVECELESVCENEDECDQDCECLDCKCANNQVNELLDELQAFIDEKRLSCFKEDDCKNEETCKVNKSVEESVAFDDNIFEDNYDPSADAPCSGCGDDTTQEIKTETEIVDEIKEKDLITAEELELLINAEKNDEDNPVIDWDTSETEGEQQTEDGLNENIIEDINNTKFIVNGDTISDSLFDHEPNDSKWNEYETFFDELVAKENVEDSKSDEIDESKELDNQTVKTALDEYDQFFNNKPEVEDEPCDEENVQTDFIFDNISEEIINDDNQEIDFMFNNKETFLEDELEESKDEISIDGFKLPVDEIETINDSAQQIIEEPAQENESLTNAQTADEIQTEENITQSLEIDFEFNFDDEQNKTIDEEIPQQSVIEDQSIVEEKNIQENIELITEPIVEFDVTDISNMDLDEFKTEGFEEKPNEIATSIKVENNEELANVVEFTTEGSVFDYQDKIDGNTDLDSKESEEEITPLAFDEQKSETNKQFDSNDNVEIVSTFENKNVQEKETDIKPDTQTQSKDLECKLVGDALKSEEGKVNQEPKECINEENVYDDLNKFLDELKIEKEKLRIRKESLAKKRCDYKVLFTKLNRDYLN